MTDAGEPMTLSDVNQARVARIKALRAEGRTYREIGDELGISPQRARQLQVRDTRPQPDPGAVGYPLHPLVAAILDVTDPHYRDHHPS